MVQTAVREQNTEYLRNEAVWVTRNFVRIGATNFFLYHITSVANVYIPANRLRAGIIGGSLVGFLGLIVGFLIPGRSRFGVDPVTLLLALLIGGAIGFVIGALLAKPSYEVRIHTSGGETRTIDQPTANDANQIFNAVMKAIIENR